MAIVLGDGQYGKAEVRLLRVNRGASRESTSGENTSDDEIRDLNVTVTLRGDFGACYTEGDNSVVLTTDAQKNTVFAFADHYGVSEIEEFALRLARHFVTATESTRVARVRIEQYPWDRVAGHSFARSGSYVRTTTVTCSDASEWVVSGLTGLTLLNTTGSEFRAFLRDEYTTLAETSDRILATDVVARWRYQGAPGSWAGGESWDLAFEGIREQLVTAFAETYSYSLQHTLFAMGRAALEKHPEVAEIRLTLPNKHHFEQGSHDVYFAADRPYGLIEGTVTHDDAAPAGQAW
jgi:urate oxidase